MMSKLSRKIFNTHFVTKLYNWPQSCSFKSLSHFNSKISDLQNTNKLIKQQSLQDNEAGVTSASNSAMEFPCLDAIESKTQLLEARSLSSGPEPTYTSGTTLMYHCKYPLLLDWGGVLPEFSIAYESWGKINHDRSNVILLHTGLSASSHAHSTATNPKSGWWEKFIGPGRCLDTDKYHIVCTNVLGGCYGSTGPSSIDPADGQRFATRFPILTIQDMVRAQFRLLDELRVEKLYASVGSSMGGMQSLAAAVLYPDRVSRIVSISGCARSHPYGIAMRHTQRQVLMMDPKWNRGFYYNSVPPHAGMKLAREIATITYRSGPEWDQRFGRRRADPRKLPALCPDFLVETYLDHSGEKFCLSFDANSLLYVSKAIDLFDIRGSAQTEQVVTESIGDEQVNRGLVLPNISFIEQPESTVDMNHINLRPRSKIPPSDISFAFKSLSKHPVLIMGVESDILFPTWQQKEIVEALKRIGNSNVIYCELSEDLSLFGHDTFLLDVKNIGGNVKRFLG
ncbi:Serine O-succinyltransferase [Golovinomyces cichoracearum]|uniref:Serine O-succinyltransferase n=1 Tax=Golovinomyces cichoracearum TaxID=62708 RepID=A0A420H6N6_9PEZI|nr:Serine O-succinyltransferase [Golovinomyces cichoracearum]